MKEENNAKNRKSARKRKDLYNTIDRIFSKKDKETEPPSPFRKDVIKRRKMRVKDLLEKIKDLKSAKIPEDVKRQLEFFETKLEYITDRIKKVEEEFVSKRKQIEKIEHIKMNNITNDPLNLLFMVGKSLYTMKAKKDLEKIRKKKEEVDIQFKEDVDKIFEKYKKILSGLKNLKESKTVASPITSKTPISTEEEIPVESSVNEENLKVPLDILEKITGNLKPVDVEKRPPEITEKAPLVEKVSSDLIVPPHPRIKENVSVLKKELGDIQKILEDNLKPEEIEALSSQKRKEKKPLNIKKELNKIAEKLESEEKSTEKQIKTLVKIDNNIQKTNDLIDNVNTQIKQIREDSRQRHREQLEMMDEQVPEKLTDKRISYEDIAKIFKNKGLIAPPQVSKTGIISTIGSVLTGAIGGAGMTKILASKGGVSALSKTVKSVPAVISKTAGTAGGIASKLASISNISGKALKLMKIGGPVGAIATGLGTAYQASQEGDPLGRIISKSIGSAAGSIGGGFLGGVIGNIPGAIAAGLGGSAIGEIIGEKIYDYFFGREKREREGRITVPETKITKVPEKQPSSIPPPKPAPTQEKPVETQDQQTSSDQLKQFQKILGNTLGLEAAKVAITEGGFDRKTKTFNTASINKKSQAAGAFQFLPSVALELAGKTEGVKDKFSDLIQKQKSGESLTNVKFRQEIAERVAGLSLEDQLAMYKNYILPLIARGEKIDAGTLKAYGFAPAIFQKNKQLSDIIYKKGSIAVAQNQFLDLDKSGDISKEEILAYSGKIVQRGENIVQGIMRNLDRPVISTPPPLLNQKGIELARESNQRNVLQQQQPSVQITSVNNTLNQSGGNQQQLLTTTLTPARNPDPIYQKSLEKTYVG